MSEKRKGKYTVRMCARGITTQYSGWARVFTSFLRVFPPFLFVLTSWNTRRYSIFDGCNTLSFDTRHLRRLSLFSDDVRQNFCGRRTAVDGEKKFDRGNRLIPFLKSHLPNKNDLNLTRIDANAVDFDCILTVTVGRHSRRFFVALRLVFPRH